MMTILVVILAGTLCVMAVCACAAWTLSLLIVVIQAHSHQVTPEEGNTPDPSTHLPTPHSTPPGSNRRAHVSFQDMLRQQLGQQVTPFSHHLSPTTFSFLLPPSAFSSSLLLSPTTSPFSYHLLLAHTTFSFLLLLSPFFLTEPSSFSHYVTLNLLLVLETSSVRPSSEPVSVSLILVCTYQLPGETKETGSKLLLMS